MSMMASIFWSFLLGFVVMVPFVDKLVSVGGLLFFSAFIVSGLVGMYFDSWFAFILFLIYVSGLLVLFGYMLAMSSNFYQIDFFIFKFWCVFFVFLFGFNFFFCGYSVSDEMDVCVDVMSIFVNFNLVVYWFMVFILLISLIVVVNLCYKSPRPLRSFII